MDGISGKFLPFFMAVLGTELVYGLYLQVCDCRETTKLGAVDTLRFSSCGMKPYEGDSAMPISYTIFEHSTTQNKFRGYACKSWIKDQMVETFWSGATDTINYQKPSPLSFVECWALVQTGSCDGNQMKRDGNGWKFDQKPTTEWRYLKKVGKEIRNCLYEEITLTQNKRYRCLVCGRKLSDKRSKGFAVTHATTYVWDPTADVTKVPCEFQVALEGKGVLNNQTKNTARIRDVDTQVDFTIERNP